MSVFTLGASQRRWYMETLMLYHKLAYQTELSVVRRARLLELNARIANDHCDLICHPTSSIGSNQLTTRTSTSKPTTSTDLPERAETIKQRCATHDIHSDTPRQPLSVELTLCEGVTVSRLQQPPLLLQHSTVSHDDDPTQQQLISATSNPHPITRRGDPNRYDNTRTTLRTSLPPSHHIPTAACLPACLPPSVMSAADRAGRLAAVQDAAVDTVSSESQSDSEEATSLLDVSVVGGGGGFGRESWLGSIWPSSASASNSYKVKISPWKKQHGRYDNQRKHHQQQQQQQPRISPVLWCCIILPYILLAVLIGLILTSSPLLVSAARLFTTHALLGYRSSPLPRTHITAASVLSVNQCAAPAAVVVRNESILIVANCTVGTFTCPPSSLPVVCPQLMPAADAVECPLIDPPFIHDFDVGVWNKVFYDDWLRRRPGDDPRFSPAYPRVNDQTISVLAAAEAGGRLSVSQMQVVVATAGKYHRERGDPLMAAWGSQVPVGRIHMYSDGEESEQQLPVVYFPHTPGPPLPPNSTVEPPHAFSQYYSLNGSDSHVPYVKAQVRFLQGMQHSFPLMLADESVRWLMVVDDDTFVFWPNLLAVVAQYNSSEVHSLGNTLIHDQGKSHNAGGAGWLLSRGAVVAMRERIVECYGALWGESDDKRMFYDVLVVNCFMEALHTMTHNREELEEMNIRNYTHSSLLRPDPLHPPDLIYRRSTGKVKGATFHYMKGYEMLGAHNVAMMLGCGL